MIHEILDARPLEAAQAAADNLTPPPGVRPPPGSGPPRRGGPPGAGGRPPAGPPPAGGGPSADLSPPGGSPPPRSLVLCLSGGGLRATFFHLGVIRYLCQVGELKRVRDIFSVSGGSILAAHLAQRWNEYADPAKFDLAARDLRSLGNRDVRGRILRRSLAASAMVGLPLYWPRFRRERLLVSEYQSFFGRDERDIGLNVLRPERGPRIHLLTTSLTTGGLCEFTSEGFSRIQEEGPTSPVQSPHFTVPLAVAASSAFPPMFPPIELSARKFRIDPKSLGVSVDYLTDGGVYDNLGMSAAIRALDYSVQFTDILASDASAPHVWNTFSRFRTTIGRTVRSTDVLMQRVARLSQQVERLDLAAYALGSLRAMVEWPLGPDGNPSTHPEEASKALGQVVENWRRSLELPSITVIRIDGSHESDSASSLIELPYQVDTFEGKRTRGRPRMAANPSSWAQAMAAMRTDLDTFSAQEIQYLEAWGFAQASQWWSAPSPKGPPGVKPDPVCLPPNDAQIIALQQGARRKWRLLALPKFVRRWGRPDCG